MKCALITGASRGIGRETALRLAESGEYPLIAVTAYKNEALLTRLAEEIRQRYPEQALLCYTGDLGSYEEVCRLSESLKQAGGTVSLLVNNAAISMHGLLADLSPEDWEKMISTNLSSVFHTCKLFQPDLLRTEGRIINISSVWGAMGASCEAAYSAAKGGLTTLTRALAKELAPSHVAVNALELGTVDTEMNGNLTEEEKAALAEEIPFGRFATPEEAAEAIYLLSRMPAYVTGAVLRMDGGWI